MTFWVLAGVMTAAAAAFMLLPLARDRRAGPGRDAYDLEVYRDQLAEIASDVERGLLGEEQASAARIEIERRILARAPHGGDAHPATGDGGKPRRGLLIAAALAAPVAALALYLYLGSPGTPGRLPADRAEEHPAAAGDAVQIGAMVAGLAARVEQNPDDLDGWRMLARSYMILGRDEEAVAAWTRAAALDPTDAGLVGARAEALVKVNQGRVTAEARQAFEAALALDAKEPGARFYLGLADAQAGRLREALGRWEALAADVPAETPWLARLQSQIAALREQLAREGEAGGGRD